MSYNKGTKEEKYSRSSNFTKRTQVPLTFPNRDFQRNTSVDRVDKHLKKAPKDHASRLALRLVGKTSAVC